MNKQKDKLIELISKVQYMGGLEEKLADHLLANGVIVPPCKVGDTVYFVQDKKVYSGTVVLIRPFIHKETTNFHGNVQYECEDPFYQDGRMMIHTISVVFQEFGNNQIAYFTPEAAKKHLKGAKNNDGATIIESR